MSKIQFSVRIQVTVWLALSYPREMWLWRRSLSVSINSCQKSNSVSLVPFAWEFDFWSTSDLAHVNDFYFFFNLHTLIGNSLNVGIFCLNSNVQHWTTDHSTARSSCHKLNNVNFYSSWFLHLLECIILKLNSNQDKEKVYSIFALLPGIQRRYIRLLENFSFFFFIVIF